MMPCSHQHACARTRRNAASAHKFAQGCAGAHVVPSEVVPGGQTQVLFSSA